MKKYVLLLAVLAMSTSAWGFGIGNYSGSFNCPPPCPTPNPCPTPCPNPGAVIGGDFAGQGGLLYSSPCAPVTIIGVDSYQGAASNQGQIGCFDWSCFTSFGDHHVYGGPLWGSFTYMP
jgi:hypothetical protein